MILLLLLHQELAYVYCFKQGGHTKNKDSNAKTFQYEYNQSMKPGLESGLDRQSFHHCTVYYNTKWLFVYIM